ncbi:hypothetical protein RRF57_003198 [Xylaria bambusicola]|uniref:Uncharacterized protein n=1 Tax=Xylaria bambusicola TaxID=326684 RepID=A0AAN7UTX0_9PEZI
MEPESSSEAIRVPRRKSSSGNADEVVETRYTNSKYECRTICKENQHYPNSPTQKCVTVDMLGMPEEADKDKFGCRVAIEAS